MALGKNKDQVLRDTDVRREGKLIHQMMHYHFVFSVIVLFFAYLF